MAEYHIISLTECEKLKSCYVTLRNKIHHLNLLGNPVIVDYSAFAEEREFVCSFWNKLFFLED